MNNYDRKILELLQLLKDWEVIRFVMPSDCEKQNLVNIKSVRNHFTLEHIEKVVKVYKVNANWIFGASSNMVFTVGREKEKEKTSR